MSADDKPVTPAQLDLALQLREAWEAALADAEALGNGFVHVWREPSGHPAKRGRVRVERLDPSRVTVAEPPATPARHGWVDRQIDAYERDVAEYDEAMGNVVTEPEG